MKKLYSIKNYVGHGGRNRVTAKAFKYADTMHKFLSKQYDNNWIIMKEPVKSGVYFEQYDSTAKAFKLINIKTLVV